jgi:hypothetical protein
VSEELHVIPAAQHGGQETETAAGFILFLGTIG